MEHRRVEPANRLRNQPPPFVAAPRGVADEQKALPAQAAAAEFNFLHNEWGKIGKVDQRTAGVPEGAPRRAFQSAPASRFMNLGVQQRMAKKTACM